MIPSYFYDVNSTTVGETAAMWSRPSSSPGHDMDPAAHTHAPFNPARSTPSLASARPRRNSTRPRGSWTLPRAPANLSPPQRGEHLEGEEGRARRGGRGWPVGDGAVGGRGAHRRTLHRSRFFPELGEDQTVRAARF